MNRNDTTFHIVNEYSEDRLKDIIRRYGEERWAARIAKFIVEERKKGISPPQAGSLKLSRSNTCRGRRRTTSAKRTFQAIRIEVNDELEQLERQWTDSAMCYEGGSCVSSPFILEDRIVKEAFARRANPCICPPGLPVCACGNKADIKRITGKPITPGKEELEENPRSRSAKLRVIEKLGEEK